MENVEKYKVLTYFVWGGNTVFKDKRQVCIDFEKGKEVILDLEYYALHDTIHIVRKVRKKHLCGMIKDSTRFSLTSKEDSEKRHDINALKDMLKSGYHITGKVTDAPNRKVYYIEVKIPLSEWEKFRIWFEKSSHIMVAFSYKETFNYPNDATLEDARQERLQKK